MGVIELALMSSMDRDRKLDTIIAVACVVALGAFWMLLRQQTAVSDKQFLRSMIPHHAGAILMCEEASIRDPEIRALCKAIVSSQQSEIDQMKAKLGALQR